MCQRFFEIRIARRDKLGQPIPGKYLEFSTDDAGELCAWYERSAWRKPFKRKKKRKKQKSKTKHQAKSE
jgi:hypothetical protein